MIYVIGLTWSLVLIIVWSHHLVRFVWRHSHPYSPPLEIIPWAPHCFPLLLRVFVVLCFPRKLAKLVLLKAGYEESLNPFFPKYLTSSIALFVLCPDLPADCLRCPPRCRNFHPHSLGCSFHEMVHCNWEVRVYLCSQSRFAQWHGRLGQNFGE